MSSPNQYTASVAEKNLALVQRAIDAARAGDYDAVKSLFAPDLVKMEPPGAPYGGVYRGTDELGDLIPLLEQYVHINQLKTLHMTANNERVITISQLPVRRPVEGKESYLETATTWVIRDDQIVEQKVYSWDLTVFGEESTIA